jgi:hypothetical protein
VLLAPSRACHTALLATATPTSKPLTQTILKHALLGVLRLPENAGPRLPGALQAAWLCLHGCRSGLLCPAEPSCESDRASGPLWPLFLEDLHNRHCRLI